MTPYRSSPALRALLSAAVVLTLLAATPGSAGTAPAGQTIVLPQSAFNITDHNLTYATNMLTLSSSWSGSFAVSFNNSLTATASSNRSAQEAQIAFGPGPAGAEEANITPIFILQESSSGLLRLEYIPFAMSETYGFIVYEGSIVPAGPHPFLNHTLTLTYRSSAPGIAPYPVTVPFGYATGNVSLSWDSQILVPQYPIVWANLSAFYGYGLTTGSFAAGSISVAVAPAPDGGATSSSTGILGPVPTWAAAGLLGAAVGAVAGGLVVLGYRRRSKS